MPEHPLTEYFDISILQSLQRMDEQDDPFFLDFVLSTMEHFPEMIAQMQNAFTSGNYKQVGFIAHKLKGSCGNIGAISMQEIAISIETAIDKTDFPQIDQSLDSLKIAAHATEASFTQWRTSGAPL